jgi:hypothetical protein
MGMGPQDAESGIAPPGRHFAIDAGRVGVVSSYCASAGVCSPCPSSTHQFVFALSGR